MPAPPGRRSRRVPLALALPAALIVLAAVEGVLSLSGARTLRSRLAARGAQAPEAPADAARQQASPAAGGLYQVHPDPLVGYALRARSELDIAGGGITADALGLRARPADRPAPREGALRLLVLGDSVAFGFGLGDDETLAHRLELLLDPLAAHGVVARTVAVPGWNHRNAVSFLLDHADELTADVIVYMPIGNDLADTDGIYETGHRRAAPDVAQRHPLLSVFQSGTSRFLKRVVGRPLDEIRALLGPTALNADLSTESQRRYDDNAASVERLVAFAVRGGARVLVAHYRDEPYVAHLQRRLDERLTDLAVLPLFSSVPPELTLGHDPHPNAATVTALAAWIARELVELGWVPGADAASLPEPDARYAELRAPRRTPAERRASSEQHRAEARAALHPALDVETLTGCGQVYGGLNPDGSVGAEVLVLLARGGDQLVLTLRPLPGRPDLAPLRIAVLVDGLTAGAVTLETDEPSSTRLPIPTGAGRDAIEVRLVPERWVAVDDRGVARIASFVPVRIACEP